jgi:hypothetical protein
MNLDKIEQDHMEQVTAGESIEAKDCSRGTKQIAQTSE